MTRRTAIDVSTRKYVNSHGVEPRGRAPWWFLVMDGNSSPAREHDIVRVPQPMTLSDAKVWAKAAVRERFAAELKTGYLYLEVAP